MPRIWTELLKHMLHRHTVISVSQQSIAEQLVETHCSVNCIGMQMPSHLWINIHHGKGMYKETQGLWHVALPLPRDVLPDGVQPTSSGLPFPASVGYGGFTLAKKRSLQARSLCVLRIWGYLKLQAVLHNQLTAIKAPEKPPMASRISALFHCMWKWRKSMSFESMAKKQPNHSGTLKGIQAFVWVARVLHFIKAMLLRRRWTQEMKHKILFDMFLPSILIRYTKYYGRKLPVSALV